MNEKEAKREEQDRTDLMDAVTSMAITLGPRSARGYLVIAIDVDGDDHLSVAGDLEEREVADHLEAQAAWLRLSAPQVPS